MEMSSFFLGIYLGVELLVHMINTVQPFEELLDFSNVAVCSH